MKLVYSSLIFACFVKVRKKNIYIFYFVFNLWIIRKYGLGVLWNYKKLKKYFFP